MKNLIILALCLYACNSYKHYPIVLADGRHGYRINCSKQEAASTLCDKEIGNICKGKDVWFIYNPNDNADYTDFVCGK